jgi:hypothetical protein
LERRLEKGLIDDWGLISNGLKGIGYPILVCPITNADGGLKGSKVIGFVFVTQFFKDDLIGTRRSALGTSGNEPDPLGAFGRAKEFVPRAGSDTHFGLLNSNQVSQIKYYVPSVTASGVIQLLVPRNQLVEGPSF